MCKSRSSRLLNIFSKIWGHFTPLWCFKKLPLCPSSCHILVDCTLWIKFKGSELLKWTASVCSVVTRWRADSTPPSPDVFALRPGDRCTCCGGGTRSHREWTKSDGASMLIKSGGASICGAVLLSTFRLYICDYCKHDRTKLTDSLCDDNKCHSFFLFFCCPVSSHPSIHWSDVSYPGYDLHVVKCWFVTIEM